MQFQHLLAGGANGSTCHRVCFRWVNAKMWFGIFEVGIAPRWKHVELFGGTADTTNNRMELQAAIEGLKALKESCAVTLTTDSVYVKNGITTWLEGWKKKGWKTAARKPVKNVDLWQALDEQNRRHQVQWQWVKGHSGHAENERADQLANRGIDEMQP